MLISGLCYGMKSELKIDFCVGMRMNMLFSFFMVYGIIGGFKIVLFKGVEINMLFSFFVM